MVGSLQIIHLCMLKRRYAFLHVLLSTFDFDEGFPNLCLHFTLSRDYKRNKPIKCVYEYVIL